eukprot:TRINITY_DN5792_c0_g1_i3.p1 TRINITY_DN5792_c0_g1~~TRINITY_DN5792_c0_g1_i3.p1  ORF type:complete len:764 (+),score=100.74 TRINITY_DN5792_c0_g1_i3:77-2368(+)
MDRASAPSAACIALLGEIRRNRAAQVERILDLDHGKCLNSIDLLGWTPLHHAAYLGHAKIAEALLERGAEINARDRDGLTPLHLSVANGNVKVASVLLKNGANANIADRFGRLPIDVSVDKTTPLLPARSPQDISFHTSPSFKSSYGSPLSQSGFVDRSAWTSPYVVSGARRRTGLSQYDDIDPSEMEQYEDGPEVEYEEAPPFSPARLSDSEDSTSSSTGTYQQGDQPKSKIKENAMKVWLKAKQVAKWQILSIAVRILLCYLLELFVENLKRVLHFIVITYTPYEIFLLLFQPLRWILSPIWPLLGPIITPIFSWLVAVVAPIAEYMAPIFAFLWTFIEPIVSMFYQLGWFIVDKLQYFIVPLQRAIWDPLVRIATALYSTFGPGLGWMYQTFIAPFIGVILRVLFALFTPFYEVGKLIVQKFAGTLLQPIWLVLQRIGLAILQFFANNYQKIMANIWAAIHPMLNIRGFFSRVFGPLITGLKAVLHWFLPDSIIKPMDRIAVAIFGRDPKNGEQDLTTEETALIVLFVFIMVVYGSVITEGYAVKLILICLYFFDNALSNRVYDLLSLFSDDGDADTIPMTFSWILPDFWHHQIGIIAFVVTVGVIVLFRFVRFLFWLTPIIFRWTYNGIKNFNWRKPFSSRAPAKPAESNAPTTPLPNPLATSGPAQNPTQFHGPQTPRRSSVASPRPMGASPSAAAERRQPLFDASAYASPQPQQYSVQSLSKSVPSSPVIHHGATYRMHPTLTASGHHYSAAFSPGY